MDKFLSRKRTFDDNKASTSAQTSIVRKLTRKYSQEYLKFEFTITEVNGEEKSPVCYLLKNIGSRQYERNLINLKDISKRYRATCQASAQRSRFASCLFNNMTSETVEVARIACAAAAVLEIQRSSMDCAMRPCIHIQWVYPVMILSILLWLRTWMLKLSPTCRTLC
ncbi:hypothetical protein TNCV_2268631 [Trichonephila clavipes]|nr:hypothetical protein TNCV_2268631 [Trichonephila clavipes]